MSRELHHFQNRCTVDDTPNLKVLELWNDIPTLEGLQRVGFVVSSASFSGKIPTGTGLGNLGIFVGFLHL